MPKAIDHPTFAEGMLLVSRFAVLHRAEYSYLDEENAEIIVLRDGRHFDVHHFRSYCAADHFGYVEGCEDCGTMEIGLVGSGDPDLRGEERK